MPIIKRKKIIDPDHKVDGFSEIFTSVFFIGHIPVASGTFGTAAGLIIFLFNFFNSYYVLIPLILICFFVGIKTSDRMLPKYGHDPSVVVIDEVVGVWVTMLFVLPVMNFVDLTMKCIIIGVAFITFRFFDIVKVWPSRKFDRMESGYGIMMDDVVAGLYAGVFTFIIVNTLILSLLAIGLGGK
jgi:phosphatidylglycerophosphatase A